MKELLFIAVLLAGVGQLFAQCTINQANTTDGFTPSVLPCITAGTPYSQSTQLHIPTSVTVSGLTFPVDSVMLLSISGMPTGITYAANPAAGQMLYPNDNGCVHFSGTTNDTSGTYTLVVFARIWIQAPLPGLSPADVDISGAGFGLKLQVCGGGSGPCTADDTLSHIISTDTIVTYTLLSPNSGYVAGNNSFGVRAIAERFDVTQGHRLSGTLIYFSVAKTNNPNRMITITAYDDAGGIPGPVLATQTVAMGTIMSDITTDSPTYIDFPTQPAFPGTAFYLAVTLPQTSPDTIALWTTTGSSGWGQGFHQLSNGTWDSYFSDYGVMLGNVITPLVCTGSTAPAPVANFTSNVTSGCAPLTVQFADLSTNSPTSWAWTFVNANPSSSSLQNPSVTFFTAGTYNVTLTATNASGSDVESRTGYITVYEKPTVNLTKTDASCTQTGSVTSSVFGGSGFTYQWNNGATTPNLFGVSAGTYTLTVTNSNNCTASASATVGSSGGGVSVTLNTTNTTCGLSNGSATALASGGSGYTYNWSNGASSQTVSSLSAGTYTVTVTASNGCTAAAATVITASSGVSVALTKTNAACGISNGSITSNTAGGSGYTYSWNTGATTQNLNGLGAGTYTLTVTATGGCTASASEVITSSSGITVTLSKTDAACAQANGSVTSNVTGGTGYTYQWNNGVNTANLNNIAAGTYIVTVTATGGCTASASATVNTLSGGLSASAAVGTTPNCGQSNGTATVTTAGGTTPYTYAWNTNPTQNTSTASNISAGTYTVTVTDNAGCTTTASVSVSNVAGPNALIQSTSNVRCYNGNDGSVSLTANGGTAPYSYSSTGVNYQSPATFSGLTAGSYTFYVKDANNCVSTTGTTITQPTPLAITFTKTDVACFGDNTGNATANVTGGTPTYTYTWSNSQSGVIAVGLTANSYSLVVADNNGCTVSSSVTVTQPAAALSAPITTTDVACFGGSNGGASVSASGGTTPYSYQWSNGQNGVSVSSLNAGTLSITVTDIKGCSVTSSATVSQPASALNSTAVLTNISCFGDNDGSIATTVSGGTSPYSYAWSNSSTLQNPLGLDAGNYVVTITDAHGCTFSTSGSISEPSPVAISALTIQDATSPTAHDGAISVSAAGGTSPYTYLWSNSATTATNSGLMAGSYAVTVTDANGCFTTSQVIVNAIPVGLEDAGLNGEVNVFPNPTSGLLLLNVDLKAQRDVQLEVVDVVGAVVQTKTIQQVTQQLVQLDMSAQANGVYFVRIKTADGEMMRKVVVAK